MAPHAVGSAVREEVGVLHLDDQLRRQEQDDRDPRPPRPSAEPGHDQALSCRIIYVHGGVAGRPPQERARLDVAVGSIPADGSSIDVVEAALRALEDDPTLNAGTGAVLTRAGKVELDAGICDSSGGYGGVTGVTARNPISLARKVMEATPHVLLTGPGADALWDGEFLEPVSDQLARWERARAAGELTDEAFGTPAHVDTVGAVALDTDGKLAAGSSTGGVFGKLPGRVGDAAILGAGLYASHDAAVVGTGVGELFLTSLACFRVGVLIAQGSTPQEACRSVIAAIAAIDPRPIGLLALDAQGRAGAAYAGGHWQLEGPDGPFEAELVSVS